MEKNMNPCIQPTSATLQCAVFNNRSCNVAQKLDFTHEGLQRDEIKLN